MEKNLRKYIVWTYVIFWCSILMIGASMLVIRLQIIITVFKMVISWIPTFVVCFMFHKIFPDDNIFSFIKRQFKEKVHLSIVFSILGIYCLLFAVNLFITSIFTGTSISALLVSPPSVFISAFFYQLVWGPMGEELGWRAYMLNQLQKKYSPLKSALIIAIIWGFWHTPLWFLTSGYSGLKLIRYIVCFLIWVMAISIIMAAFYSLNHNLIIPMLIHQLSNYIMAIQTNDLLDIMTINAVLYLIVAAILVLINYKKCLYGKVIV